MGMEIDLEAKLAERNAALHEYVRRTGHTPTEILDAIADEDGLANGAYLLGQRTAVAVIDPNFMDETAAGLAERLATDPEAAANLRERVDEIDEGDPLVEPSEPDEQG
jgi:hypothetical protein